MRKRGWILLLVLLCVAFLMSCGKDTEPDEAKGELVRIEREGCQDGVLLFLQAISQSLCLHETLATVAVCEPKFASVCSSLEQVLCLCWGKLSARMK